MPQISSANRRLHLSDRPARAWLPPTKNRLFLFRRGWPHLALLIALLLSGPATTASAQTACANELLPYEPPFLNSPITVTVHNFGPATTSYTPNPNQPWIIDFCNTGAQNRDIVLNIDNRRQARGLSIHCGRDLVIIGGRVYVPPVSDPLDPSVNNQRALNFRDQTGTVHIEGLLLEGPGMTDAMTFEFNRLPRAAVHIQNVRINDAGADGVPVSPDPAAPHPDLIQTWEGPRELRVYRLTGSTRLQGISMTGSGPGSTFPDEIHLEKVDIVPTNNDDNVNDVLILAPDSTHHSLTDFWMRTGWNHSGSYRRTLLESIVRGGSGIPHPFLDMTLHPAGADGRTQGNFVTFGPGEDVDGEVFWGNPAEGDFVPHGCAGTNYTSPGYLTSCLPKNRVCSTNSDCCSGRCRAAIGGFIKTCR